jgi:hypothetical protein
VQFDRQTLVLLVRPPDASELTDEEAAVGVGVGHRILSRRDCANFETSAAEGGFAGVGHIGLLEKESRSKSSCLRGSGGGLRSTMELAGLEPATSWVR